MKSVNKTELVARIAKKTGFTKVDSAKALEAVVDSITDALSAKKGVRLVGFGSFKVSHRKARAGRNPQTGDPLKIAARDVPVFKAGKNLKQAVNK